MPAVPQYQTFGADPSTFDDPTIYQIREIEAGMSEEEIKEIYSVAGYPHDDLHDLIPGTPPDSDFSNAKPTNQVAFNTFATYIEPYFRPLNEEDLAFLRERVRL
jgi:transcriptional adapter 3